MLFTVNLSAYESNVKLTKKNNIYQGMRYPSWSPDNKWIVFSLHGDIWKVNAQGGKAIRLTLNEADDEKPRWSPDGKTIIFSSNRNGNFDIWSIPAEGGKPKQITFHGAWDSVSDWTPDSKWILFYSIRSGDTEIWKISSEGGLPIQVTFDKGRDASISPDGSRIAYIRGGASLWIKGYNGSANWDIYTKTLDSKSIPDKLTTFEGNDRYPFFSNDAKSIYFIRETDKFDKNNKKHSVYNLWIMGVDGKNKKQLTTFDSDIITPYFSKDGKKVLFEKDFQIWEMSLSDLKPKKIDIYVESDTKNSSIRGRIISKGNEMGDWSPSNEEIAFILDGDIWIMPANGGNARQITNDKHKNQWPRFSPDGQKLAYYSNKSGNDDIYIINLKTNEEYQLTHDKSNDFFHNWSPDGSTIIFTSERSGNRDLWIIPSEGGTAEKITDSKESEDDAEYSPDGKWIIFDSGKSGHQEIWIMPSDGDFSKARQLTTHKGLTQVASWSPNSQWIAYETTDYNNNSSIMIMSVFGKKQKLFLKNATMANWSSDGQWIMFEKTVNEVKSIYKIKAPTELNFAHQIPFLAHVKVDIQKERVETFQKAWETIQKGFYDAKLHGVDWRKMHDKYKPLAEQAQTDLELDAIINRMIGELGASHMGISSKIKKNKATTGYLGWTLKAIPQQSFFKIESVLKDGPADKVWIREGDYLFMINGEKVTSSMNINKLFNGTIGKKVKLLVGPTHKKEDARDILISPVSSYDIDRIKYKHWLVRCIRLVKSGTKGQVVYVHLPEMNVSSYSKFQRIVIGTQNYAKGMILDIRNNGGGNIHQALIQIFMNQPYLIAQDRAGKKYYQPKVFWNKPVVVLINENSFSDAEVFPHIFKQLRRGYVIGNATPGEVIGTRDVQLSPRHNV